MGVRRDFTPAGKHMGVGGWCQEADSLPPAKGFPHCPGLTLSPSEGAAQGPGEPRSRHSTRLAQVGAGLGDQPGGLSKPQGPQDPRCALQLSTYPSFLRESKFL